MDRVSVGTIGSPAADALPWSARRSAQDRICFFTLPGLLVVYACSGGGGGGGIGAPLPVPTPVPVATPAPSPAPVPTPTPTPTATTAYDTAEYRESDGLVSMHALTAYERGATGAGVAIGIVDSGIDLQSREFGDCSGALGIGSCRVLPASQDLVAGRTIDDEDGHGSIVAFIAAGGRNSFGTHGAAFDAKLLVARTDIPGSCEGAARNCKYLDQNIALGIDAARQAGVRVINLSLGGNAPSQSVLDAVQRATMAGIVIVVAAGNDDGADPNPFAAGISAAHYANGLVIIAGSVSPQDTISSFSSRAGPHSNFLMAVGQSVFAPDALGIFAFRSGTSFAAPQIAGAVALLAQAFPNLTGAQIVDILFATARKIGDPGAGSDPTYGQGVIDLARAFQPVGSLSLAGSRQPASTGINGSLSTPMGDAAQGPLTTVVLDRFDRAFRTDLGHSVSNRAPARSLRQLMVSRERSFSAGVRDFAVAVTLAPHHGAVQIERLGISVQDAYAARLLAATVSGQLGSKAQFAIGASESGNTLTARLAGRADPAFLIARDPAQHAGFDVDVTGSAAIRHELGPWGIAVAQEQGEVLSRRDTQFAAIQWKPERHGYSRFTIGLDRRLGGLRAGVSLTRMREENTILGARFSGALGAARGNSSFVDLGLRFDAGAGWSFGGSMRHGWTEAQIRAGLRGSGLIRTNAFAADFGKQGIFADADSFGFRVAQPLRVAQGAIDLALPGGWDYATESVDSWNASRINLAPQGREIAYELRYAWPLVAGDVSAHLFLRRQPDHFADMAPDKGGAIRLTLGF